MPNQGNKSNGNQGIAKPKKNATMPATENQNGENGAKKEKTASKSGGGNAANETLADKMQKGTK